MKLQFLTQVALIGTLAATSLPAASVTITFEALPEAIAPLQVIADGYQFHGGDGIFKGGSINCGDFACPFNGTHYLFEQSLMNDGWSMTNLEGKPFSLFSFEGAEAHMNSQGVWSPYIEVTGTRSNGATVVQRFALDFIQDGHGPEDDFQKFMLSSDFIDLMVVSFRGYRMDSDLFLKNRWFSVDNIEVELSAPIPAPSTLALLGTTLSFGWMGYKRALTARRKVRHLAGRLGATV